MRKVCFIFILCFLTTATFAQQVAYVNEKPISTKEFMWVFKKNSAGLTNPTYQDLEKYLSLYINFKLKVAEARAQGLDTDTAYKKEVNNYEYALKAKKKPTTKNIVYDFLANEYREGVLMFNISEKMIWSKLQENELKQFYQKNNNIYKGKNFDEVRAQVISDYQQFLEIDWINYLRAKYTVKVNEEELKKLTKP